MSTFTDTADVAALTKPFKFFSQNYLPVATSLPPPIPSRMLSRPHPRPKRPICRKLAHPLEPLLMPPKSRPWPPMPPPLRPARMPICISIRDPTGLMKLSITARPLDPICTTPPSLCSCKLSGTIRSEKRWNYATCCIWGLTSRVGQLGEGISSW